MIFDTVIEIKYQIIIENYINQMSAIILKESSTFICVLMKVKSK